MTSNVGTYDIAETYAFNYERGPVFSDTPRSIVPGPTKAFLGLPVRSRIGIAAGLLLNSKWIAGYAERGFDILTYKTVRSSYRPCYPPPNWVFVEDRPGIDTPVYVASNLSRAPTQWSSAVCFGMPSMPPEVWRADIPRAKAALKPGQILVVSVVATPGENPNPQDIIADFARCAGWAGEAGADVVEANYSCPNVCSAEGSIYTDSAFSRLITKEIRKVIDTKPLLLKVGHYAQLDAMRDFLRAINGLADGITLVNAISRPVLYPDGRPAFGDKYRKAGVLGRAIHAPSVQSVREARQIITTDGLALSIAAVGGISTSGDAEDFFEAGADAVLMGSSPMYQPDLAADLKLAHPEW